MSLDSEGQRVMQIMRKFSRNETGTLSCAEYRELFLKLDSSGYWTDAKIDLLLQACGPIDGHIPIERFVSMLYQSDRTTGDYQAVRADLCKLMNSPDWDDGSYAPILIRLAWHSSGTYCAADGTGGSNGATMRYEVEANDPENAGLGAARDLLEPLKLLHPWVSFADLWILAAYVAIEHTGGPSIPFTGGRVDAPLGSGIAPGRLPGAEYGLAEGWKVDDEGRMEGWETLAQHIRDVFGRMGLDDKEAVALISGGHVYGRCHTASSGYAGAWVENPTFFSNEYCADMIEDKWIPVTHDTVMPDGGAVPEEVRPMPGKRQYIDLSKYEDDAAEEAVRAAPDAVDHPVGMYRCVSQWVNCREMPDIGSPIVGRFVEDQIISLVSVKVFGTAVRGQAERGGWVSIIGSAGKTLFERIGELSPQQLIGNFRVRTGAGAPIFGDNSGALDKSAHVKKLGAGEEFYASEISHRQDGALLGKTVDARDNNTSWALIYSPVDGLLSELIVQGYNEKPRKAIKGQSGHQMMLVSDMVLLWDPGFKQHLEVYAEDLEILKRDFGTAFKRLTELGCSWSNDRGGIAGSNTKTGTASLCPFLGGR
jgi:hypothetical protein